MRELKCTRCGADMFFMKQEKIQLGQTGYFLGDWPNILAGSLEVEIYGCNKCGKLELMMPGYPLENAEEPEMDEQTLPPEMEQNIVGVSMEGVPQVLCPACGLRHDFDYPRCPRCSYEY